MSIRWTVAKQLVDLLRAEPNLGGVQVESGWPNDQMKAECVWIESIEGDDEFPLMTSGTNRQITDDHFTVPIQFRVANRKNNDDTMTRLSELSDAIKNIVKDDPSLGLFDDGVLGSAPGNAAMTSGPTREGYIGWGRMVIAVHAREF